MAEFIFAAPQYAQCKAIQREMINVPITEELLQTISDEATIPLFEQNIYDYKNMKHNSLQTNKLLKCRFHGFIKDLEGRKKTPFQFPKAMDDHFLNYMIKYDPKITTINRANNRLHLKNGPGVDLYGQMPIPNDMHLRKTEHGKTSNAKKDKAVKNNKRNPTFGDVQPSKDSQ